MQQVEEKTVDIDTSGPEVDVELKEEASTENQEVESTESTEETVETKQEEAKEEPEITAQEPQKEDNKKDLEEYSEGVQKRIAKLTRRMREAERQKEEAIKFAQAQQKQREMLEKQFRTSNESSFSTKETSIKAGLEAAKAKLAKAREDGDLDSELDAQRAIGQLSYAEAELKTQKEAFEADKLAEKDKKPEQTLDQAIAPRSPDPKAEAWAQKNSWFGNDQAMTYTAFSLHDKLQEEGIYPDTDEYYAEIDKRIRLEFPHKFGNNQESKVETTRPVQQVASAKRSTNSSRKTVRLTPSQVAIAKKLGVPLEDYAKQLKLITKE